MLYKRKSFSVPTSERCSQEKWDAIFGKKKPKDEEDTEASKADSEAQEEESTDTTD